jgi:hypothetical protein
MYIFCILSKHLNILGCDELHGVGKLRMKESCKVTGRHTVYFFR